MKSAIGKWLPKHVRLALRVLLRDRTRFSGPYATWREAANIAGSYADADILARVAQASREVLQGRAAYEQDSVTFVAPSAPDNILAVLRLADPNGHGNLNILDFGGALGSVYHRVRPFVDRNCIGTWNICEQPGFVQLGQAEFQQPPLVFLQRPEYALHSGPIDVLIISSVLQYLPQPEEMLLALLDLKPRFVLIDRTPLSPDRNRYALVQHVPASIYRANYPMWLLPSSSIKALYADRFDLISQFTATDSPVRCAHMLCPYQGMILSLRTVCGNLTPAAGLDLTQ